MNPAFPTQYRVDQKPQDVVRPASKDDAILDIEVQFSGIMKKIELAYGRYFLGNDLERSTILRRIHVISAEGLDACTEFRRVGQEELVEV